MKKIQKKLLPYKLVILGLIIILGGVGFAVKAADKPTLEDAVNQFLSNLQEIGQTPSIQTEQTFGGLVHSVKEVFTAGVCFDGGGQRCIVQKNSVLKYTNDGGATYAELNTSQSSTGGWNTNPTTTHIYPGTNSSGNPFSIVVGATASTSIAGAADVLMVVGDMSVTGAIAADGGSFTFNNASANDLDFRIESAADANNFISDGSGDAIGIGVADPDTKLEVLKAGTQLKLSYDGSFYSTFAVNSGGDLTIVPSGEDMSITGDLTVSATSTATIGLVVDTNALIVDGGANVVGIGVTDPDAGLEILNASLAQLKLSYDGSTYNTFTLGSGGDLVLAASGGDFSFSDDNITTTGNVTGANGTFSGAVNLDGGTLYVANTTDRVGIGSTTPFATLSVDTNAGDRAFVIGSSTATILTVESNYDLNYKSGAFFLDYSSGYAGLGSTTPFTALGITNTGTQLSLAYDATNYATLNTGSAGYLNISPSGLRTGIGTTTPFGTLAIETSAGVNPFVIGSSTATYLKVDSSGLLTVLNGVTLSSTLAAGATTITGALTASTKIGVASTTPFGQLGIGTGGTAATSTISAGKFCMLASQENGVSVYVRLTSTGANGSPFATSTTSCF